MKTRVAFLFWFQIVAAWVYAVPQAYAIASGKTEGLTLVLYAMFMVYSAFSFFLAIASYKINKDSERRGTIFVFAQWIVFNGVLFCLGLRTIPWKTGDTIVCIAVLILLAATIVWYRGLKDPFSKGFMAVWCRAIPHTWLAYTMLMFGKADSLPIPTLIASHCTSLTRLAQVWISGKSGGWDRPTKGLLIGELANVITWMVVTAIWVTKLF